MQALLKRPVQIAYAARDVSAAAARFSTTTGAGPFFIARHIVVTSSRIHGKPAAFDHSSAYGQWGDVMVELVVEHSPPIVESRSGVHHLAFMVPNLRTVMAWCVEQGWPEVLWAETASGQQFAFCDARAERGHLIELYEPSAGLLGFYAMVKNAAKDWDGSDPLRSITA